jgi:hypothetical protein
MEIEAEEVPLLPHALSPYIISGLIGARAMWLMAVGLYEPRTDDCVVHGDQRGKSESCAELKHL